MRAGKKWMIEKLHEGHDVKSFDCGKDPLNTWLRKFSLENQRISMSQTFVAVSGGSLLVDGYYSVCTGAVAFNNIPSSLTAGIPKYPNPVAHMARLAVTNTAKGHGLGETLLFDAFERILRASELIGINAVEVFAKDEDSKSFYRKYGFTELKDNALHLYVPIRLIKKLGLA